MLKVISAKGLENNVMFYKAKADYAELNKDVIDHLCLPAIEMINAHPRFVTNYCCSGHEGEESGYISLLCSSEARMEVLDFFDRLEVLHHTEQDYLTADFHMELEISKSINSEDIWYTTYVIRIHPQGPDIHADIWYQLTKYIKEALK